MNVYEVLYYIGVISKREGLNKMFSASNAKAALFKQVLEYIENELKISGDQLVIVTNPALRTNAIFNKDAKQWTVYINLNEHRIDKICILCDFMHEYGHTKREVQDKNVTNKAKIEHERSVWKDAWKEISDKFVGINQFRSSYDAWKKNCLDDYWNNFKPSARGGTP